MDEQKFKDGDIVKHKTAEFKMVIVNIREIANFYKYTCRWFSDICENEQTGFKTAEFEEYELDYYKPTE